MKIALFALLAGTAYLARAECLTSGALDRSELNNPQALRTTALKYERAGQYANAFNCLKNSLATARKQDSDLPVLDLIDLANLATVSGKFADADSYFLQDLKMLEHHVSNPALSAEIYMDRGWLMEIQGAFGPAESNYKMPFGPQRNLTTCLLQGL